MNGEGPYPSWAEWFPARVLDWKEEEGCVILFVPRFGRGRVGMILQRWFPVPPYRVRLDETGSFIWRICCGGTSVAEIARALRKEFGDRVEPVEERLILFLKHLIRGRFISLGSFPAERRVHPVRKSEDARAAPPERNPTLTAPP